MSENPIHTFIYNDRVFATGLFRLHDEVGFPLSFSIVECVKRGWRPCLLQFRADAIRAGWSRDRAARVVSEAVADAMYEDGPTP